MKNYLEIFPENDFFSVTFNEESKKHSLQTWIAPKIFHTFRLETHNETLYSILKLTCDGEIGEAKLRIKKSL